MCNAKDVNALHASDPVVAADAPDLPHHSTFKTCFIAAYTSNNAAEPSIMQRNIQLQSVSTSATLSVSYESITCTHNAVPYIAFSALAILRMWFHVAGSAPQARHSHAATVTHSRMYVFGGTQDYQQAFPELHALDLGSWTWHKVAPATACCPPGCFSHSLSAVNSLLVLAGGCHTLGSGLPSGLSEADAYCCVLCIYSFL